MTRTTLAGSVATCLYLALAAPLFAAELPTTGTVKQPQASAMQPSTTKPAEKCLSDLRAFDSRMGKDGYWLGGSGYGYGYPMGGDGYEYGYPMGARPTTAATGYQGYQDARPGYEVRILVASANILAKHGQQQACENVLATSSEIYKVYVADLRSGQLPMVDVSVWRQHQIATAQPVTATGTAYRSDELVGTDVRTPQDDALGSVEDLVTSPKTGAIAYVVIGRGGIFGIDEKYVPVPWAAFKISSAANLLVLDTTKAAMDTAPQVARDQNITTNYFDQESQKVDAYWKARLTTITGSK